MLATKPHRIALSATLTDRHPHGNQRRDQKINGINGLDRLQNVSSQKNALQKNNLRQALKALSQHPPKSVLANTACGDRRKCGATRNSTRNACHPPARVMLARPQAARAGRWSARTRWRTPLGRRVVDQQARARCTPRRRGARRSESHRTTVHRNAKRSGWRRQDAQSRHGAGHRRASPATVVGAVTCPPAGAPAVCRKLAATSR